MAQTFGQRVRELRSGRQLLQSAFAEKCGISPAYLSDIERGKRNPPTDKTLLEWSDILDPGNAEEIGAELVSLAARDRGRAEAVTEAVVESASTIWEDDGRRAHETTNKGTGTPFLDYFGVDLVEEARQGGIDPAPGRDREFGEIARVLACRRRNSVAITGPDGSPIGQLGRGLAQAIAAGRVPPLLAGLRILKITGLQAGVKYRGQLEERVKALVDETVKAGNVVLFFHSLADLVDLEKSTNGSMLGPALEEGVIRVVTGATSGELAYCTKANSRLVDCFRPVAAHPLDRDAVLRGLHEIRDLYVGHHHVDYADEALVAIVDAVAGDCGGDETHLWQRSLDLLDAVGAQVALAGEGATVRLQDVDAMTANPNLESAVTV
jgi:ATP-dependent Clp protease ATP-binding subunit ClpC